MHPLALVLRILALGSCPQVSHKGHPEMKMLDEWECLGLIQQAGVSPLALTEPPGTVAVYPHSKVLRGIWPGCWAPFGLIQFCNGTKSNWTTCCQNNNNNFYNHTAHAKSASLVNCSKAA